MPAAALTPVNAIRARVLALVLDGAARGRPVKLRELSARGCGALNNVHGHVARLAKDGWLKWEPGCAGTLMPTCRWIPAEELDGEC